MSKKKKFFADDGWAIWIDGDNTSTVFINDWLSPRGKSYIDLAVNILGIKSATAMHVYVPFALTREEIEDVSLSFNDRNILYATFGSACIVDYMKNEHASEIAYNGKTVDIVHISTVESELRQLAGGTLINVDLTSLMPYIDNDDVYFIWRMPHKTLDELFVPSSGVMTLLERFRDLFTSPVRAEKYGYSIRINEARLLPDEITSIGAFHRQKLSKAAISISVGDDYEINDASCYRIRRLERNLYKGYLPKEFDAEDAITYQWNQTREHNLFGHFNFYFTLARESISKASMTFYLILLVVVGVAGEAAYDLICFLVSLF